MKTEIYWNAVQHNDAKFNGAFVYAVNSTKIYCKPSCSSKLPKRENVQFYRSPEMAEDHGFRACLRCQPKSETVNPQTEIVLRACELIESEEQIKLEDLSAKLNLSPAHLQKTFKEIIGISPKKYAESKRLEKFKGELKNGSEVADAMYEAGFGSSSRLYENVADKLGMTPAAYKKGGKDMRIEYTIAESTFGKLLVARTAKGVCAVSFGETDETLRENLQKEFPNAEVSVNDENLKSFVEAILANFAGTNKTLDLPLDVQATAFQMRVWEFLRKIPYGETVSYQQAAEKIGNKNAVRAVATACASNRIAVVIPCHRVVRSSGELSGYRWGVERKKQILESEKR